MSRNLNFGKENLTQTVLPSGPLAATVSIFNDMQKYINKHRFLQVLYTLSSLTFVPNMHAPR